MTKTEHTPTPWVFHVQPAQFRSGDGLDWSLQAEKGPVICLLAPGGNERFITDMRAVIRAVNSHAALVEALEAAKDELADQHDRQVSIGDEPNIAESLFELIGAALTLAKGA